MEKILIFYFTSLVFFVTPVVLTVLLVPAWLCVRSVACGDAETFIFPYKVCTYPCG